MELMTDELDTEDAQDQDFERMRRAALRDDELKETAIARGQEKRNRTEKITEKNDEKKNIEKKDNAEKDNKKDDEKDIIDEKDGEKDNGKPRQNQSFG